MKAYFLDGHNHKWFLFLCVFSLQDNVDHHSTKFSTSSSLCRSWFVFLSPFSLSSVLWESAFPRPLSMYQWNCDFLFLITLIFFFLFSFSLNLQRFWHIQSIVFSTFSVELFFVSSSFFCILWEDCPAFINIYDDSFYITVQNSSYFFITIWLCFFIFGLEFGSHLSLF